MRALDYLMTTAVALTVAYFAVTSMVNPVAQSLNQSAAMIEAVTNGRRIP